MTESSPKGKKTLCFQRFVLQTRKNQGLFGNALNTSSVSKSGKLFYYGPENQFGEKTDCILY